MAQKGKTSGEEEHEPEWADDPSPSDPAEGDADADDVPDESSVDDEESQPDAKHSGRVRVEEDMGTLALHPELLGDPGKLSADPHPTAHELAEGLEKPAETGDAEIMLRLKAGELECFDYLMNKYRRPIVHFMFRMVHNQGVAEEMAQEVFLRVYRSRETYRAEAKFSTWLYRIATNLAVNHARDTKNERLAPKVQLDEPDPETGSMHDVADSTPTVESNLLRQERMSAIKQHVLALPERQRMAVLMHKYQDMDYKAIGGVLNLSESATKSLLFRAYQTLRERLKEFV